MPLSRRHAAGKGFNIRIGADEAKERDAMLICTAAPAHRRPEKPGQPDKILGRVWLFYQLFEIRFSVQMCLKKKRGQVGRSVQLSCVAAQLFFARAQRDGGLPAIASAVR